MPKKEDNSVPFKNTMKIGVLFLPNRKIKHHVIANNNGKTNARNNDSSATVRNGVCNGECIWRRHEG